jgi:hypothetical protein
MVKTKPTASTPITDDMVKEFCSDLITVKRKEELEGLFIDRISYVLNVIHKVAKATYKTWYLYNEDGKIKDYHLKRGHILMFVREGGTGSSVLKNIWGCLRNEFSSDYLYMTDEEIEKYLLDFEKREQAIEDKKKEKIQQKEQTRIDAKVSGLSKIKGVLNREELISLGIKKNISKQEYEDIVKL